MDTQLETKIKSLIDSDRVVLFMKGRRAMPQCGFSAQVVQILDELLDNYTTVNVLDDGAIREGIKAYSDWPTIPQLYVSGQFVGGCDIVRDMFGKGELQKLLGAEVRKVDPPTIRVSDAARQAIEQARDDANAVLRLSISPRFEHGLGFEEARPSDIVVESNGIRLVMDSGTARRANGLSIDFVTDSSGTAGFKIENPNAAR